jgi:predicted NAD/FAD-dependent oxidoreductase
VEENENLASDVKKQLKDWYGNQVDNWNLIKHFRIKRALPVQKKLPPAAYPELDKGVFLCGDYLENASLNGAMASGRIAAEAVIQLLDPPNQFDE